MATGVLLHMIRKWNTSPFASALCHRINTVAAPHVYRDNMIVGSPKSLLGHTQAQRRNRTISFTKKNCSGFYPKKRQEHKWAPRPIPLPLSFLVALISRTLHGEQHLAPPPALHNYDSPRNKSSPLGSVGAFACNQQYRAFLRESECRGHCPHPRLPRLELLPRFRRFRPRLPSHKIQPQKAPACPACARTRGERHPETPLHPPFVGCRDEIPPLPRSSFARTSKGAGRRRTTATAAFLCTSTLFY